MVNVVNWRNRFLSAWYITRESWVLLVEPCRKCLHVPGWIACKLLTPTPMLICITTLACSYYFVSQNITLGDLMVICSLGSLAGCCLLFCSWSGWFPLAIYSCMAIVAATMASLCCISFAKIKRPNAQVSHNIPCIHMMQFSLLETSQLCHTGNKGVLFLSGI